MPAGQGRERGRTDQHPRLQTSAIWVDALRAPLLQAFPMNRLALALIVFCALAAPAYAGSEQFSGKEMKQVVPPPCPEWYGDTEWNVSAWGTYAFTDNDEVSSFVLNTGGGMRTQNITPSISPDLYLETDHAWGGGVDLKYFFHRYFGIGIEGLVLDAKRERVNLEFGEKIPSSFTRENEHRAIGAVLGTFTIRYPIGCTRFAPYIWGGGGAIFGGGESDILHITNNQGFVTVTTEHTDGSTKFLGQVGGGLELRITRHIGWVNDFSWNFIAKVRSDFGMVRSGVNFAF